ncbi:MAG: NADH:flavin oxidoreductase/NADH oxidase family protein [Dongiaceae bacterium]
MTNPLSQPLVLPCGATLSNRLCKAAMSEGLADADGHSTRRLEALYRRWAVSGAGLLLTGNVQVDRWHLERPGNLVVDDESGMVALTALATAGKSGGAQFWAQLSHTGRQVEQAINPAPLAPSRVGIDVMPASGISFATPLEMTEVDIDVVIEQFAFSAGQIRTAGFTGVQLHAAHGYLLSQFLNPLANRRTDEWGGSLENRGRLLQAVIGAVRLAVGPDFPIGIKLNVSDFQRGGFTHADCLELVGWLNDSSLDLLELSGGSLEQPKMVGISVRDEGEDGSRADSVKREAYFLALAGAVRMVARMPVMVTGGFRSRAAMIAALEAGELDLIGLCRPLIADPLAARRLLTGAAEHVPTPDSALAPDHLLGWHNRQVERLADGLDPDLSLGGAEAAAAFAISEEWRLTALLARRDSLSR